MKIRDANADDLPFLEEMLFEAFFWNPDATRPSMQEFLEKDPFRSLLANWGRAGDCALIAVQDGLAVGAAWYRFWTDEVHSYGFVDADIPELGMGVRFGYRSRGVGRALLRGLIAAAKRAGTGALSLSVDPSNFALSLYESEGFQKVGEVETSWTMVVYL
jgi:ribosomal protein S18 acetylase RimI-like enzyme